MLGSCSKFLDKEPISAGTDESFWKSEAEAVSAISGAYALLRTSFNDALAFYAYGDYATDQFRYNFGGDYGQVSDMTWNLSFSFNDTWRPMMKLRRYDNFYRVIDQANRCIKYIPQIPLEEFSNQGTAEADRARLVGEAYFLRAFTYFYMARVWGGVPLVKETAGKITEAVELPRSTEEEVLAEVKASLTEAIKRLSWGYSSESSRAIRANKGAAFSLLAHTYAWEGNYEDCAKAADSVLLSNNYAYVSRQSYLDIFKGKSSEGIFEIAQNANNEGSAGSISFYTLRGSYLRTYTGTQTQHPLDATAFRAKFPDQTDLRVQKAFAEYSSTDPFCIKYSNILYTGQNNTGPIALNNIIVFRLSDIALLRAEALAATGRYNDARPLLNNIISLAKPGSMYTGADANMLKAIFDERGRELFLEGHRYYDLVRQAKATGTVNFGGSRMPEAAFTAGKYQWPVDPYLMSLNPRLEQTQYWKDKM